MKFNQEIKKLTKEQTNYSFSFAEVRQFVGMQIKVPKLGQYFPYNFEYEDSKWGCAWRAICMFLSSFQTENSSFLEKMDFKEIYELYSGRNRLLEIFKHTDQYSEQCMNELLNRKWAPQEIPYHWAEPFIGYLIAQDLKAQKILSIKVKLSLLNGYPKAYAPECVFQQNLTYPKFRDIIINNHHALMIDDGQYASVIIGHQEKDNGYLGILVGDPHIVSNRKVKNAGQYFIELNEKGAQVGNSLSKEQKKVSMFDSYSAYTFQNKPWMILYC